MKSLLNLINSNIIEATGDHNVHSLSQNKDIDIDMERVGRGDRGEDRNRENGERDKDKNNNDENSDGKPKKRDGDDDFSEIVDKESSDESKEGNIRVVKSAHLVYKRQTPNGTYDEMWIYNSVDSRRDITIRRAILAGTDISVNATQSLDRKQSYKLWGRGNGEIMLITGLVN